ncbi:Inositol-pentakisphosphate 2-kinase [Tulasnella sp. 332]|nr:Inositol-pentakisphosphate 2-kinase [Tulasnella sp. 332]
MTTPAIIATSPADWTYVSEGGQNIVLAYDGPPHPTFSGTALRLRATPTQLDLGGAPEEPVADDPSIAFQARVISLFIPSAFLPLLQSVELDKQWLEELAAKADPNRPLARKTVQRINVKQTRGVLASNLIGSLGWAVEIKPKWGFLPSPYHLSNETRSAKLSRCRFCMHAHYRSVESDTTVNTHYCPLDLYSGNETRVHKALQALCEVWATSDGSTNNLKIFAAGKRVTPSDALSIQALGKEMHLVEYMGLSRSDVLSTLTSAMTNELLPVILDTSILRVLSELQRTLDPLDIEGLAQLWNSSLQSDHSTFGTDIEEVTMEEWVSFGRQYSSWKRNSPKEWGNLASTSLRYYLVAYLLSATFKDCSIIIHFCSGLTPSIAVIDLGPKGVSRFPKWYKLDRDVVRSYIETGDQRASPCID